MPEITASVLHHKESLQRSPSIVKTSLRRKKVMQAVQTEQASSDADVACQTYGRNYQELLAEIVEVEYSMFRLENIKNDDEQVLFYTGFPIYSSLMVCYNYLGPSVSCLEYWGCKRRATNIESKKRAGGRCRSLPRLEEFFLVLVRLRLGLFEKDLADRFGISTSTMSFIIK